jgi:hypothetical protein
MEVNKLFHFGRPHWDDLAIFTTAGAVSMLVLETPRSRWFRAGKSPTQSEAT